MSPQRIQRKRTKGWRMPEGAIYVGRPTKWGNPFTIGLWYGASGPNNEWSRSVKIADRQVAFDEYVRASALGHPQIPWNLPELARQELAGHDLACWCPLDQPCHADVLLEIANSEARP